MQLMNSDTKKTGLKFNLKFNPTVGKLLAYLSVIVFIFVVEIIYLRLVSTNKYDARKYPLTLKLELRPDLVDIVNPPGPKYAMPMDDPYRLENTTFCSSTKHITVLVIVLSSGNHFINRQVIRQTWANGSLFSNYGTVRTLFLLGCTDNVTVESKLEEEFNMFGDILQGYFVDSLRNLTHKSIMAYNWVRKRCRNVNYVLKTDDDIVLNMFELLENRVLEISLNNHHVLCRRVDYCVIDRHKHSKVYVEPHQFKGKWYYPPFCSGQFVAMENDVVPFLYEAAIRTPYFWIDDVHMYGLSMNNIPALKYKQIQEDNYALYEDIKHLKRLKQKTTRLILTQLSFGKKRRWRGVFFTEEACVRALDVSTKERSPHVFETKEGPSRRLIQRPLTESEDEVKPNKKAKCSVREKVWALYKPDKHLYQAKILDIVGSTYTVKFTKDGIKAAVQETELKKFSKK